MKTVKHLKVSPGKSPKKRQPSGSDNSATVPAKRPKILLVDEINQKRAEAVTSWVDKYKPVSLKNLIGQQTDKSPSNKLFSWLQNWGRNHLVPLKAGEKKKARPSPFQAQTDGSSFKAALLSGPPGIGKTTAAILCSKELGLAYVELNASDVRNKAAINRRCSEQLDSHQIEKFCKPISEVPDENIPKKSPAKKGASTSRSKQKGIIDHVLIMDEVDGMSGNADRAGIAELITMIKRTRIPIICICNDRQSRKIRSLANHCFDLRFQRPRAEQIKGRLMSIAAKERANITREALDKIIEASHQDIRQCINTLQLAATSGAMNRYDSKNIAVDPEIQNIFEAARQILSSDTPLPKKNELYFTDYSMMPLFIQENYPNVRGSGMKVELQFSNLEHLAAIRRAADSIAFGDIVDKQVRSHGNWNLLPAHAMFSCCIPASIMDGHMTAQIQFPGWFGKYSNAQKRKRLMRQLSLHTHLKITGSNQALVQDYLNLFRERLYRPLITKEGAGVKEVLAVYSHYSLLREDTDAINELGVWPLSGKQKDLAAMVNTKTKSALTRQLNKEHRKVPWSQGVAAIKGGTRRKGGAKESAAPNEEVGEKDDEDDEEEEIFSEGEEAAMLIDL